MTSSSRAFGQDARWALILAALAISPSCSSSTRTWSEQDQVLADSLGDEPGAKRGAPRLHLFKRLH